MARNKYPQETVERILDVSLRRFMEKGYEHTSIQDIIDHLGGLSKGAIYHHFKSKEDILEAVVDRMNGESNRMLADIRDRKDLNGKEKIKTIFRESICRPVMEDIFTAAPNMGRSPQMVYSTLKETVDLAAPRYILPIIRQGMEDGSIQTEYPEELAEVILLIANVWLNPMVFDDTTEKICRKFWLFQQMLQGLGMDILDEDMLDRMKKLTQLYQNKK